MSEEKLVNGLRNNDEGAYRYLMRYYPMCRKIIWQHGLDEQISKDIFQESILILFENLQKGSFQLNSKVSTYLYAVCRNLSLDESRRNGRMTAAHPDKEYANEDSYEIEMIFGEYEDLPSMKEILKEIEAMGSPCRYIIQLSYFNEAAITEIMKKMNYPTENATRQAKNRCMKRLKKIFKQKK